MCSLKHVSGWTHGTTAIRSITPLPRLVPHLLAASFRVSRSRITSYTPLRWGSQSNEEMAGPGALGPSTTCLLLLASERLNAIFRRPKLPLYSPIAWRGVEGREPGDTVASGSFCLHKSPCTQKLQPNHVDLSRPTLLVISLDVLNLPRA